MVSMPFEACIIGFYPDDRDSLESYLNFRAARYAAYHPERVVRVGTFKVECSANELSSVELPYNGHVCRLSNDMYVGLFYRVQLPDGRRLWMTLDDSLDDIMKGV